MDRPIHVATTRTVKPGCEEDFEKAVLAFFPDALRDTATEGDFASSTYAWVESRVPTESFGPLQVNETERTSTSLISSPSCSRL